MELSYLRPLFAKPGPWASVYLDATHSEQDAAHEIDLRWRALRERLVEQGAGEDVLVALEEAIVQRPYRSGRYGLAVFANGDGPAVAEPLPAPPAVELAAFDALPYAMPMVSQRGDEIPYVRVISDRTGADVTGLTVGGTQRTEHVKGGDDYPLTKVRGGGWSNPRYQRAAEETWKRNAGDVAKAVGELAQEVGAEVIVVGGDVREVPLIAEKLPKRWRDRVVTSDAGTRHATEEEALDEITAQAIADVAARHVQDAIDRYLAQPGPVAGLTEVVTRLQRGQADTVLLTDHPDSTDKLWIAESDPALIAVDARELQDAGVQHPVQVRADEALLRAIVGTGAELVLVQPEQVRLEHGIGAVLRYADGDTAAT